MSYGSDRSEHVSSGIGPDCEGRRVNHAAQAGGGVFCGRRWCILWQDVVYSVAGGGVFCGRRWCILWQEVVYSVRWG